LSTVALLAFLMLSHGQAGAQTYQTPTQAIATIDAQVAQLTQVPTKSNGSQSGGTLTNTTDAKSNSVNDNSVDLVVELEYLAQVKGQLTGGQQDVGAAIENVYTTLAGMTNGRPTTRIDTARLTVKNLLKA